MEVFKKQQDLEKQNNVLNQEQKFIEGQIKKMNALLRLKKEIKKSKVIFKANCVMSVLVMFLFISMYCFTNLSVVKSLLFQLTFLCNSMVIFHGLDWLSLENKKRLNYFKWSNFKEDEIEMQKERLEENYQKIETQKMIASL